MAEDTPSPSASPERQPTAGMTFVSFVFSLARTAAVHFGDVPDPATGRPGPPNLPAARQMIDILALLEEKTRGNLGAEERQLLEQLLAELRLRFIAATGGDVAGPLPSAIVRP